jgi:large subunit ribosomal protein L22
MIFKTLKSAIANAKEKNMDLSKTFIKIAKIDGGPSYKRGLMGSRGRMYPIQKSSSHITIILSDEEIIKTKGK